MSGKPSITIGSESTTRNETMEVEMIQERLIPGVEDAGKAEFST